jgi:uncharacterized membrane protein YccC
MPGVASIPGESAEPEEGDSTMTLVLLTALSVWVLMLVMDAVNIGGFLLESTIAVLGGAAIGFFGAWYLRRRSRKNR